MEINIGKAFRGSRRVSRAVGKAAMSVGGGVWSLVKEFRRSSRISRAGRRAAMAGRGGVWSLLRNSGEAAE